jgi:hypothetical protein
LSQVNPIYILLLSVWFLILFPNFRLGLSGGLFLSDFPTKTWYTHTFLVLHTHRFSTLCLITPINFSKEWKLWRSSWWNFLHPPVMFSLLGATYLLNALFSGDFIVCVGPIRKKELNLLDDV